MHAQRAGQFGGQAPGQFGGQGQGAYGEAHDSGSLQAPCTCSSQLPADNLLVTMRICLPSSCREIATAIHRWILTYNPDAVRQYVGQHFIAHQSLKR